LQQDISRQVMVRIPPHAVLAPDHPLAAKATLSLADLAGQPLILTNQGLSISHMRGLFTHRGLVPVIAHSTATLDLMRSYAAHGLGVGLSYTNPAGRLSSDGKPFVTRPLRDAGSEALVLAQLAANPPSAAASLVASLLPQVLQGAAFPNRSDP
jgi:DNA-binding transcriptional LysR family regulator